MVRKLLWPLPPPLLPAGPCRFPSRRVCIELACACALLVVRLLRPSVLDNFALLSGQLNTINKLLKNEKTPSFRNQLIIPLLLSQDRDDDLAVRRPDLNPNGEGNLSSSGRALVGVARELPGVSSPNLLH